MKGVLLFDKDAADAQAESWLRKAVEAAREQGARAFELRAALALAASRSIAVMRRRPRACLRLFTAVRRGIRHAGFARRLGS